MKPNNVRSLAGAYVGLYQQWQALNREWRRRLKRDGIKYFHTTDYYSLREEFARFRDPLKYPKPLGSQAAKAVLDDLEGIIHKSGVMGVAVCIDVEAYKEIRKTEPHAVAIFPEDAFEAALRSLVEMCAIILRDEDFSGERRMAYVCDESNTSERIARVYIEFKRGNPDLAEYMGDSSMKMTNAFPSFRLPT